MPRTKLSLNLPDTAMLVKLIERYIKIESGYTVGEALDKAQCTRAMYYRRIKEPEEFSLAQLRRLGRALNIPQQELTEAIMAAIRY